MVGWMRAGGGVALIVATILGMAGLVTTAAAWAATDPVTPEATATESTAVPPAESPSTGEAPPAPEAAEGASGKDANGTNGPAPSDGAVPRPQDTAYPGTIALRVDVTNLERHLFNV